LVFRIEEISPSDFGKYKSLFEDPPKPVSLHELNKKHLKKICSDYKAGRLDSTALEQQLDKLLTRPKEASLK